MTESDWATCTDSRKMLLFLRDRGASERKLRLFSVTCCRDVRDLIEAVEEADIGYGWGAVLLAEHLADGEATRAEVDSAVLDRVGLIDSGSTVESQLLGGALPALADADATRGAGRVALSTALARARAVTNWMPGGGPRGPSAARREAGRLVVVEMLGRQCGFLHDIFGNPFRPATIDPSWLTSTVVSLARTIYDARSFELMPVLADALMDAGCGSEDVLDHCRGPNNHVRGCYVVDLLLNRS
jgi:hypothetical protein